MLFSSLITFYSISTGLIGYLTKVTVGTNYGDFMCGADLGVKIKIQKPDRTFCSVPLPAFYAGERILPLVKISSPQCHQLALVFCITDLILCLEKFIKGFINNLSSVSPS